MNTPERQQLATAPGTALCDEAARAHAGEKEALETVFVVAGYPRKDTCSVEEASATFSFRPDFFGRRGSSGRLCSTGRLYLTGHLVDRPCDKT